MAEWLFWGRSDHDNDEPLKLALDRASKQVGKVVDLVA
jgi:hypothetical protein